MTGTPSDNSFQVDGLTIRTFDEATEVIKSLQIQKNEDRNSAIEARDLALKQADQHKKERRALEDQIDQLKAQLSDEAVEKKAEERIVVLQKASQFLSADYDSAGKSVAQIAKDALTKVHGADKIANVSDEAIVEMFKVMDPVPASPYGMADHVIPGIGHGGGNASLSAYEARKETMADAWRSV